MDLPEESQWDETTCQLAVCQHPQCWATIRRIERGHPRILGPRCKTVPNDEDKLPVLTIVNLTDPCLRAKRRAHHRLSGFTFTKPPTLLCPGAKFDSKFQGRPRKDLPDKDLIGRPDGSPKVNHRFKKLSVLNLNETHLPSSQDVRNMVVIWIPEQPERHMSPAEKKHIFPSQDWMKRRMISTMKDSWLYRKQKTETRLRPPGMTVPPPSPVHFFEQLNAQSVPFWNQFDMLSRDLLKDLLPDEGKTMPSVEMRTQLAMMKKESPLEKSRPNSAISAKMFLTIHQLTLQRPALRYPKHLKKLYYNLNAEGPSEQPPEKVGAIKEKRTEPALWSPGHKKQQQWQQKQQQRKVKIPPKRQEAKKKSKSDLGSQDILCKHLGAVVYGPRSGHRTLLSQKSDQKQPQKMKSEERTLKKVSIMRPQTGSSENYLDSFAGKEDPELSKAHTSKKDSSAQGKVVLKLQERSSEDPLDDTSRRRWNPELKLLRILQATDDEEEEDQLSRSQSKESFKTSEDGRTPEEYA